MRGRKSRWHSSKSDRKDFSFFSLASLQFPMYASCMSKQIIQFSTKISESHKQKIDKLKEATGVSICRLVEKWIDRAFNEAKKAGRLKS